MSCHKTRKSFNYTLQSVVIAIAVHMLLLTTSIVANAQVLEKIIPMGEWTELITTNYDGKPILVHLRTGYERAVVFPEPVILQMINKTSIYQGVKPELPNCKIELDTDVLGFAPLGRFGTQRIQAQGVQSGRTYVLLVSSSPNGKRQPIRILE